RSPQSRQPRPEVKIRPPIVEQRLAGVPCLMDSFEQITARPFVQTKNPALIRIQLTSIPCRRRVTDGNILHGCGRKSMIQQVARSLETIVAAPLCTLQAFLAG